MQSVETNHFRFIQWDITSRCNLSCIHCRSESFYGDANLDRDMTLDEIKQRLEKLWERGIRRIHFLGGEPFMRRDLPEVVRYATELGIICSINTNGTLITEDRAADIVDAGTYLLTFSIDGPSAEINDRIRGRGVFRRILKGIENVQAIKRRLRARTRLICCHTLMRPNFKTVDTMVDLCTDLGLQNLIISGLRRMGAARERYDELALSEEERLWSGELEKIA